MERDVLKQQIQLHSQLKGEHVNITKELELTVKKLTEAKKKEAALQFDLRAQKESHDAFNTTM